MTNASSPPSGGARPLRAWLWHENAAELMGGIPAGVDADGWDGRGEPPDSMLDVEFYVLPPPGRRIPVDIITRLPRLRIVQNSIAGFEHVIDVLPEGVVLCNARGVHDSSVAEWVVTVTLAMLREIPRFALEQASGSRQPTHMTDTLAGKTVLIVGYGSIGKEVERQLGGFDVEFLRVASRARDEVFGPESLPELLPSSQVVVLVAPATPSTQNLVDASFLAALPDGALVVNAGRGALVDHDALLAEVRSGRLLAAADVGVPDPLPPDHPLCIAPGFFYTPHRAGATRLAMPSLFKLVRRQLHHHLAGEPLENVVVG